MQERMSPRQQGDLGELSALSWLVGQGANVFLPWGHSPDVDMIADFGHELARVQVKTSGCRTKDRFNVTLATRGGNQSWSGLVKRFSRERCDYLFIHTASGRRWFIPAAAVAGGSGIVVGGPKYAEFEVAPGEPFTPMRAA